MQDAIDTTGAPPRRKVLAVGLDAPNHDLLERWIAEGRLPNLRALRERSEVSRVASLKLFSNEHSWIPVLTGQNRDRWDHWLDNWDGRTYRYDEASIFDWLRAPLFYAQGDRCRVIAFNLVAPIVDGVGGVQVSGWASELNECFPESSPPGLFGELLARHGPDPKLGNAHAITNQLSNREGVSHTIPNLYRPEVLKDYADALVRSVERSTDAFLELLEGQGWDLAITLYPETHTGGHSLWHLSQPHPLDAVRREGEDPLLRIYQAVDAALARLLRAVGDGVSVVFYTIDEMVPDSLENARAVLLPEFVYRWNFPGKAALAEGDYGSPPPAPRLDYTDHWKHETWRLHTPLGGTALESPAGQEARGDAMSWCPANWYKRLWPSMRAFAMPSVADGYIRVNVRGREARGVVDEAEFGAVCDELTAAVRTLVNARTGRPMVREVIRVRESAFDDDSKKPPADLIVVFHEDGPVDTVDSPLVGRIGPVPYFRSGAHQAHDQPMENLLYVSGPGIRPGRPTGTAQLEDIPATILALLGLDLPAHFDGVPRLATAEP
ncbi:MAG: hypothetical protein AB7O49_12045 [Sphingomonadales bacterium]